MTRSITVIHGPTCSGKGWLAIRMREAGQLDHEFPERMPIKFPETGQSVVFVRSTDRLDLSQVDQVFSMEDAMGHYGHSLPIPDSQE